MLQVHKNKKRHIFIFVYSESLGKVIILQAKRTVFRVVIALSHI